MDELYLEILNSPDKSLTSKKVISRFKESIDDLDRASGERFQAVTKFDVSVELKLPGAGVLAAGDSC